MDITPPAVEFTAASPKDEATALGAGWVLHVTDGGSGPVADPIDASIEVRDADGTEDVGEVEDEMGDDIFGLFTITANAAETRFTTAVQLGGDDDRVAGYYTFSATATDKAGNEAASGSRVALHDVEPPDPPKLFVVPGEDDFTFNKTLLATDNLSIASYAISVVVGTVGSGEDLVNAAEIRAGER